jgi:hypothetical protein
MKIGVMQPYFLPYIGYWQLLAAVDAFVVHDRIQYTKKGWINRNRFLLNGKDGLFTVPLEKGSDFLDIVERRISAGFDRDRLLNQLSASYRKAPHFAVAFPIIERIVRCPHENLFDYVHGSLHEIAVFLDIATPLVRSSRLDIDHGLRAEAKVLALCKAQAASALPGETITYVNAIGGQALYSRDEFKAHGIELRFIQTRSIRYVQYDRAFVPNLSIVDVMMFNSKKAIRAMLGEYDLV